MPSIEKKIRSNSMLYRLLRGVHFLAKSNSISSFVLRLKIVLKISSNRDCNSEIQKTIKKKDKAVKQYNETLYFLYKNEKNIENVKVLAEGFNAFDFPQFILKRMDDEGVSIETVSSLKTNLNLRTRAKQLYPTVIPEWLLEHKAKGHALTDALGIKRPESKEHLKLSEIEFQSGTVVKPMNAFSSAGVYLIHSENDIYDVKNETTLSSINKLKTMMKEVMASGKVSEDDWMIEQLIYDDRESKKPARDIKFFTFYGEVVLMMEVMRFPTRTVCFWDCEGKEVFAKKKREPHLKGIGFTDEELKLASHISKNIPAPFSRIDFLKGEDGFYFGEFAPRTGTYDKFTDKYDRLFGEAFIKAENRILNDLLNGKEFKEFMSLYDQ